MFSLDVLADFAMADYKKGDQRLFVKGHKANALSKHEVKELVTALDDDFETYFKAGDPATADLLASL